MTDTTVRPFGVRQNKLEKPVHTYARTTIKKENEVYLPSYTIWV